MEKEIKAKFECRKEMISMGGDKAIEMYSFYNDEGKYIGNLDNFKVLVMDRCIEPKTYDDNKVCSVGKSTRDGKWYGWSHRAMYGFKIGDKVKKGDCCASSGFTDEYLKTHPDPHVLKIGFEAKTEDDCRRMAIAFANSVS